MRWAGRPVDFWVEDHHHCLRRWKARIKRGSQPPPSHILHMDEHHDMLNERMHPNIGNFLLHAMRTWPACRVHWQVEARIDSPAMWLADETWHAIRPRFSMGPCRPRGWPRPDLVCVCTSPDFVRPRLRMQLCAAFGGRDCGD